MRVAQACPEYFEVVGITSRDPQKQKRLKQKWGVEVFSSVAELVETTMPLFVVSCVTGAANVLVLHELIGLGMPVLSETPPASDSQGLIELNERVGKGARVQVAEQYHLQPSHAARLRAVREGLLGTVSQVQISAAHGYHGISLIRRFLGITYEPCTITGHTFTSPLINGPSRTGLPRKEEICNSKQDFFAFDFGDKLGLYDFTGDQYFSWIRNQRVLVRGERGEMINKEVTYLKELLTPITLEFVRHAAGMDGNLEGNYLKGIQLGDRWVYNNPFVPAPLTDDEIAVATCLSKMAHYVDTGEAFYSLAEASQDQYLSLQCAQALKEQKSIQTKLMPWALAASETLG